MVKDGEDWHGLVYCFGRHSVRNGRPSREIPWSAELTPNNRPVPSSLVPLFQNESKCKTFHMKMSSACRFIAIQIKVIFIRMVSHLDSLWNRGTREIGNSLLWLTDWPSEWIVCSPTDCYNSSDISLKNHNGIRINKLRMDKITTDYTRVTRKR